ncbi:uncharacterized protein LOC108113116 [Drosophila eugracilis]|uniref:uncharacterized protein LOC108113116 n=1 Tax=Drosophila eugracilis TaxID=29029 RepID=UPI0007E7C8D0|nr:uncharacterized protein LOC108113116 [Drosophila eugracilis]
MAQGSILSPVEQETLVGVHHSGVVSAGSPVVGVSRGQGPAPQPQRSALGHGSVGGSRRVGGAGLVGARPHGGASRRRAGGSQNRPSGGVHGNAHQNRNRIQKPH